MSQSGSYVVIIPYREPTYELRRGGPPPEPYRAEYQVDAANPSEAIERAIEEFEATARASSVSWVREIQREGIRVEPSAP
jgi:hypothetical protein